MNAALLVIPLPPMPVTMLNVVANRFRENPGRMAGLTIDSVPCRFDFPGRQVKYLHAFRHKNSH